MARSGLTVDAANRLFLEQQGIRYGARGEEAYGEPFISKNQAMVRALATGGDPENARLAVYAARAAHLRLAHEDPMAPPATFEWRNKFTGRSMESGSDQVAILDTHARTVAAQWAGDTRMQASLSVQSDLELQQHNAAFADINGSLDPAFQQSARADKVRAEMQDDATGMMQVLRGMDGQFGQYDPESQFDSPAANRTVWAKNVEGWRALGGGDETTDVHGRPSSDYERQAARVRGIEQAIGRAFIDQMAMRPDRPGAPAAGAVGAAGGAAAAPVR